MQHFLQDLVSHPHTTINVPPFFWKQPHCFFHKLFFTSSWTEPRRAAAVMEGCDRRRRTHLGGQRHQTQQQRHWWWRWGRRRRRRRFRPLHQQHFLNYLLLQSRQSITTHFPPFYRQRTVACPQPQTRTGEGTGKGAGEVK